MIAIVYGKPELVTHSDHSSSWTTKTSNTFYSQ